MKRSAVLRVIVAIALIVMVVLLVKFGLFKTKSGTSSESYYAIFLTNNQVYFGHLDTSGKQYLALTDIYYLQQTQPLQSTDAKDKLEDNSKQQLTLIKLGKELHGPMDKMTINRDNVMFFEELGNDSKVVQTISKYKETPTQ